MNLHAESVKAVEQIKICAQGKRIAFVSGNFNIIHPGHLRLFRFAKECSDFLVVGVLDSTWPETHMPENLRLEGTKSINWIDFSFILHDSPASFIKVLKPDFVIKGKEWEGRINLEAESVQEYQGKLLFGSGEIIFSSIDLIRQEWQSLDFSNIRKPKDFSSRHGFSDAKLLEILERFPDLRICVVGDTIVDEYITCEPLGMSQEDPTIVVSPIMSQKFIGGAAIVSAHAKSLGAQVHFFSITGDDETSNFAAGNLDQVGVIPHLYVDNSRPTTLKQRYRAANKTLLRVSHLRQHSINSEIRNRIFDDIRNNLEKTNLVIFSDFNYGCLPQILVDQIISECENRGIMMVADSQSSSQVGDISRYAGMTLITPTEREARIALRDFESGLVTLAENLKKKCQAENILITLGDEGVLIHANVDGENKWLTDRLPAFNSSPKDVAGAGDSLLVASSMALAAGFSIWESVYFGSLASACQVGRIGNIPLTSEDLKSEIRFGG
ncbi:MAG: PfkB family carbohydrate kinase [Candidatus Ozemobacteraceae bacterium]